MYILSLFPYTGYHKRAVSEKCTPLLAAVKNVMSNLDGSRKCAINKSSEELLGLNFGDNDVLEDIVCLVAGQIN